jgi:sRNA-binding regulator protein Hfq
MEDADRHSVKSGRNSNRKARDSQSRSALSAIHNPNALMEVGMSFTNRPHEAESNRGNGRRMFRTFTDLRSRGPHNGNGNGKQQRPAPPETTHAENFYYLKQMNTRTPVVVVLTDGEQVRGCIEWYDKNSLKVNREGAPNLLIQKHCIKYVYKQEEE